MPLYEYHCDACATRFERIQKYSDPPIDTCPACGGAVRKLVSSPAIQFKGSGWYITDYARKPAAAKDDGKGAKEGGASNAASPSDSSSATPSSSTPSSDSSGTSATTASSTGSGSSSSGS
jgi:putative FmdB family regulatory protein